MPLGHMRLLLHEVAKLKQLSATTSSSTTCSSSGYNNNEKQIFAKNIESSKKLLELYQYRSWMEKQLGKIMDEIKEKEDKIKKLKLELDKIDAFASEPASHLDLGLICHKCHESSGHKSLHCKELPCNSWKQYGQIQLHKAKKGCRN